MDESLNALLDPAIKAGEARNYQESVALLKKIILETDSLPEAFLYIGRGYHALGEYGLAVQSLKQFIAYCPEESAGYFFLGRTFLSMAIYENALLRLKKALSIDPDNPHIRTYLGLAYLKLKHPEYAVHHLEKAVGLAPKNRLMYVAYINALTVSAIRTFYRGDLEAAGNMLRFVNENGNNNQFIHVYLAEIEFEFGNLESALGHYKEALSFNPEDPYLIFRHARVLYLLGDKKEAMRRIESIKDSLSAMGIHDDDMPWKKEKFDIILAVQAFQKGKYRDAVFYGKKILKTKANQADMHLLMGESYRNLGDFDKATNHFQRVLDENRQNIQARYGLAMILWQREQFKDMITELQKIITIDREDAIAGYYMALCMHKIDYSAKETLEAIQEQLRKSGPDVHLLNALGYQYIRCDLAEFSEKWFLKSLKIVENNQDAIRGLISVSKLNGKVKDIKTWYKAYFKTAPDDTELRREFIHFLMENKDYSEAISSIQKIIPLEKKDAAFTRLLALCYRKKENYRDASLIYRQLLRQNPENIEYLRGLAFCYDKLGNLTNALFFMDRAIKIVNASPDLLLVYGVLLYRSGNFEKALSAFRKVLEISPDDWRAFKNIGLVYKERGMRELSDKFLARSEEYKRKKTAAV
ncbi:MAG: tetratricopeptide repeat protein [Spirochaetales bacterium]|nr:MAG: tetratricopeptide repeat protein [Spirochaetales bacterium]